MKLSNYLLLIFAACLIAGCSAGTQTNTAASTGKQTNTATANTGTPNSSGATMANTAPTPAENKTQPETAPDTLLKDLYKTHEKNSGAIVQGKNRAILDKYFDKNLADLIWKDMTTHKNEVGVIDFDIFYNAQDADIKNLTVSAPRIEGDKAIVGVTFENFKQKTALSYSLVIEKGAWKISDIDYGEGNTLLKYFKEDNESSSNLSSPDELEATDKGKSKK